MKVSLLAREKNPHIKRPFPWSSLITTITLLAGCSLFQSNALHDRLLESGMTGSEAEVLAAAGEKLGFPAKIVLATAGRTGETRRLPLLQTDDAWVNDVVEKFSSTNTTYSKTQLKQGLTCLLSAGDGESASNMHGRDKNDLLALAIAETAKSIGPIDPEQAQQALRLLRSGAFFADIHYSLSTVYHVVPRLPLEILKSLPRDILDSRDIIEALANDFPTRKERMKLARILIDEIRSPGTNSATSDADKPKILNNTLSFVYRKAAPREIATAVNTLLAPENESLRLAIIVYARANGIQISEEDLDVLRDSLLNTEDPDLTPLVAHGVVRLKNQLGVTDVQKRLNALKADKPAC